MSNLLAYLGEDEGFLKGKIKHYDYLGKEYIKYFSEDKKSFLVKEARELDKELNKGFFSFVDSLEEARNYCFSGYISNLDEVVSLADTNKSEGEILNSLFQEKKIEEFLKILEKLEGRFYFLVLNDDASYNLFQKNLKIYINLQKNFIATDLLAILEDSRELFVLEKDEFLEISAEKIEFLNFSLEEVSKEIKVFQWDYEKAVAGNYQYKMLKEINEQAFSFKRVLKNHLKNGEIVFPQAEISTEEISSFNKVCVLACGTAYHSGLIFKEWFESRTKIAVDVEIASEFAFKESLIDEKTLAIVITQSGETTDTLLALRRAKEYGAKTLAITNVVQSTIASESDYVIDICSEAEIAVASTKAYTAMLIAEYLFMLYFAKKREMISSREYEILLEEICLLPNELIYLLEKENKYLEISKCLKEIENIFFIGRGLDVALALEGALKLKEVSYIHADSYPAGELKHGTMALITEKTPLVGILLAEETYSIMLKNLEEFREKEAPMILITDSSDDLDFDFVLRIPKVYKDLKPILAVVPLQLIAYYVSKERGCNIDSPRNLTKAVIG